MKFFDSFKGGQLGVLGLALAIAVSFATSSAHAGAGKEWTVFGGDDAATRYSTLDQVNTGNVSNLKVKTAFGISAHPSFIMNRRALTPKV